ncbi:DUF1758 domain-containing protein [Trichonephila inaurata madagascariensis]|uniref:DUF1758 domain-containing protein n=1 Tax=Trichonephila inaurata madagascariensis TaxID=2747483 RepID=A0A8X7CR55_9ARAC|nr:DUF1758 domain-containing protein [Trichonephila inaurata madagascariensis]
MLLRKWREAIRNNLICSGSKKVSKVYIYIYFDPKDLLSRREESKRFILSVVGRIFDPIGILGPFIIKLKCVLQDLWTLGEDWEFELPPRLRQKWQQWGSEFEGLTEIKIPRFYLDDIDQEISKFETHCFSDASKSAYGTILYLRFVTCNKETETSFICSKSRVAPMKSLTLPRFELIAALFSTDCLISYYWIRGDSSTFKPYVKNRAQEIQSLSDPIQWGHCPGKDNPAELLSRGISAVKLVQNELWWLGPPWLKLTPDHWPNHKGIHKKSIVERAPWWGGFYERLVKAIEDPLRKTLGKALLTFEELSTILSGVEVIVNHRPLTYVENDPG